MSVLSKLLLEKSKNDGLSLRDIAKATGVAHTTIARAIDGTAVNLETLNKLASWLHVDPSVLIDATPANADDSLTAKVVALISAEPELKPLLEKAVEKVERGEVSPDTVQEVLRYAFWRLNITGGEDDKQSSEPRG